MDVVPDMVEWTAMSDKREPHKLYLEYYRQVRGTTTVLLFTTCDSSRLLT